MTNTEPFSSVYDLDGGLQDVVTARVANDRDALTAASLRRAARFIDGKDFVLIVSWSRETVASLLGRLRTAGVPNLRLLGRSDEAVFFLLRTVSTGAPLSSDQVHAWAHEIRLEKYLHATSDGTVHVVTAGFFGPRGYRAEPASMIDLGQRDPNRIASLLEYLAARQEWEAVPESFGPATIQTLWVLERRAAAKLGRESHRSAEQIAERLAKLQARLRAAK